MESINLRVLGIWNSKCQGCGLNWNTVLWQSVFLLRYFFLGAHKCVIEHWHITSWYYVLNKPFLFYGIYFTEYHWLFTNSSSQVKDLNEEAVCTREPVSSLRSQASKALTNTQHFWKKYSWVFNIIQGQHIILSYTSASESWRTVELGRCCFQQTFRPNSNQKEFMAWV